MDPGSQAARRGASRRPLLIPVGTVALTASHLFALLSPWWTLQVTESVAGRVRMHEERAFLFLGGGELDGAPLVSASEAMVPGIFALASLLLAAVAAGMAIVAYRRGAATPRIAGWLLVASAVGSLGAFLAAVLLWPTENASLFATVSRGSLTTVPRFQGTGFAVVGAGIAWVFPYLILRGGAPEPPG